VIRSHQKKSHVADPITLDAVLLSEAGMISQV
jgi:hypothetical protein